MTLIPQLDLLDRKRPGDFPPYKFPPLAVVPRSDLPLSPGPSGWLWTKISFSTLQACLPVPSANRMPTTAEDDCYLHTVVIRCSVQCSSSDVTLPIMKKQVEVQQWLTISRSLFRLSTVALMPCLVCNPVDSSTPLTCGCAIYAG